MPYEQGRIHQEDPPDLQGNVRLVIELTGAGEVPHKYETRITEDSTVAGLRQEAARVALRQERKRTIADLISEGQTFNLPAITVPPGPTARQIWVEKALRLKEAKSLGLTNATALANIQTLEDDVNATYQANFINGL